MTTYNKTTLKTFFETNDVPSGTDYANLIDSQVNIVETSEQVMAGALNVPELITNRVSAANIIATTSLVVPTTLSATNIVLDRITVSAISANVVNAVTISADVVNAATVSADAVYASAARITSGIYQGVGVVSAAGTTQGTAAVLSNVINRGKGIADGATTGFTPPANRAGLVQYLFNEGASANLWPPVGGTINGLAANAVFALAASAMVTIVHLTASAMAVK
jgi:hypothetical protein